MPTVPFPPASSVMWPSPPWGRTGPRDDGTVRRLACRQASDDGDDGARDADDADDADDGGRSAPGSAARRAGGHVRITVRRRGSPARTRRCVRPDAGARGPRRGSPRHRPAARFPGTNAAVCETGCRSAGAAPRVAAPPTVFLRLPPISAWAAGGATAPARRPAASAAPARRARRGAIGERDDILFPFSYVSRPSLVAAISPRGRLL